MPVEIMKGQLNLFIDAFKNFADIPNKPNCFVIIKRKNYLDEGIIGKTIKMCKHVRKLNREEHSFNLNLKFHDFNTLDKNRQADVMHIEFWLQEQPGKFDKTGASFVGEVFHPWKHCTEPDNLDKWAP